MNNMRNNFFQDFKGDLELAGLGLIWSKGALVRGLVGGLALMVNS